MRSIDIARVVHEANRAYCATIGDDSQTDWQDAPQWQKNSAIEGVAFKIAQPSATPRQLHESWLASKREQGWKYGAVKDAALKEHPCYVAYDDLPAEQRAKDHLFGAIVGALAPFLTLLALVCVGCAGAPEDEQGDVGAATQELVSSDLRHTDNKLFHVTQTTSFPTLYQTAWNGALSYIAANKTALGLNTITVDTTPGDIHTDALAQITGNSVADVAKTDSCVLHGQLPHKQMNHCSITISTPSFEAWCPSPANSAARRASALKGLLVREIGHSLGLLDNANCITSVMQPAVSCGCASMDTSMSGSHPLSATEMSQESAALAPDSNAAEL